MNIVDRLNEPDGFALLVSLAYNWQKWPWQWVSSGDVFKVLNKKEVSPKINVQQIIMIAKAVCKVMSVVCPFIEQLP